MSRFTTDPKTVITCDVCGVTDETPYKFQTHPHLTLKRDALDYRGSACINATWKGDLCDSCMNSVATFVNDLHRAAMDVGK